MSGINFFSENLVDNASISITAGTEDAQYPLTNLQNDSTTRTFRSTGNTATLQLDLTQLRDIDSLAVVGDATSTLNITSMTVKTSITTDFSLSTPIPITLSSEFNIGYEFTTEVTHRYVQIEFVGNGTFVEVSNLFIGKRINLPFNSLSIDTFRYRHNDNSKIRFSDFRQRFIDELPLVKRLVGSIKYCTKGEQDTLDEMFLRHGRHKPLWIVVDPDSDAMIDGQFKLAMYGYLEKMPSWNAVGGQLYNTSIEMDQAV